MLSEVKIKFNQDTMYKLYNVSDKCLYAIARQTLDYVGSSKATAYKSGKTETSMFVQGVQPEPGGYFIGDFTDYAKNVYWKKNANWTNPQTRPQWFHTIWKEQGDLITDNCIKRYMNG